MPIKKEIIFTQDWIRNKKRNLLLGGFFNTRYKEKNIPFVNYIK
jgi:hypothetical protein